MPQIFTKGIRPNLFFKEASYSIDEYFYLYIEKIPSNTNYILLEPEYSNLDLSVTYFDPLSFFSNRLLHDLYKGNLKIIFDCSIEGSHIDFPYFERFLASFNKHGYDFSNFYYLSGDGIEKSLYPSYRNLYHINTLDSFFKDLHTVTSTNDKKYFFSCLNRKPRYWRSKLIYLINTDQILKSNALCSHPKITSKNQISDHTGFEVEDSMLDFFLAADEMQVSTESPLTDQMPFDQVMSHLPEVYSKVVFDVCMESYQEGLHVHNTEKLFKPIVNSVPVLVWGTPGVNTWQMTNLGLKTYEDWFDLSFDLEPNTEKRLYLLLGEIKNICAKLSSMTQAELVQWQNTNPTVIEHNKHTIINSLPKNISEFNRLFDSLCS